MIYTCTHETQVVVALVGGQKVGGMVYKQTVLNFVAYSHLCEASHKADRTHSHQTVYRKTKIPDFLLKRFILWSMKSPVYEANLKLHIFESKEDWHFSFNELKKGFALF